jgi:hypothetical protein
MALAAGSRPFCWRRAASYLLCVVLYVAARRLGAERNGRIEIGSDCRLTSRSRSF